MAIKLSIIVPVYNAEKYLEKCLTSLVNQTLKDIDIICVDDGSSDNSLKILKKFREQDSRILILEQSNHGQSAARNHGIAYVSGEYLGFVDSDDWVDLDYFEKLYLAAKKYECDIACAGFKRCRGFRNSIKKRYKKEQVLTSVNDKVKADNIPHDNYVWNKIYKRENWSFDFVVGRYFEDIALVIKILHKMGKMVTVPNTYYNYRVNPTSTTASKSEKISEDFAWAKSELKNYAEENNIQLTDTNCFRKREYIKFLNLTLIKIYHYKNRKEYKLLGFIPFLTKIKV